MKLFVQQEALPAKPTGFASSSADPSPLSLTREHETAFVWEKHINCVVSMANKAYGPMLARTQWLAKPHIL